MRPFCALLPSSTEAVTRVTARREERGRGIPARYTRVSVGLEEPEDLISDFKQVIEQCG